MVKSVFYGTFSFLLFCNIGCATSSESTNRLNIPNFPDLETVLNPDGSTEVVLGQWGKEIILLSGEVNDLAIVEGFFDLNQSFRFGHLVIKRPDYSTESRGYFNQNLKLIGYGKLRDVHGHTYEGNFLNDELDGIGKATYGVNHFYIGHFKDGKFHGHGILTNGGTTKYGWYENDCLKVGFVQSGVVFDEFKSECDEAMELYAQEFDSFQEKMEEHKDEMESNVTEQMLETEN
jgi:hypothetical protein